MVILKLPSVCQRGAILPPSDNGGKNNQQTFHQDMSEKENNSSTIKVHRARVSLI